MTQKITITLQTSTIELLESAVDNRGKSKFIDKAIRELILSQNISDNTAHLSNPFARLAAISAHMPKHSASSIKNIIGKGRQ